MQNDSKNLGRSILAGVCLPLFLLATHVEATVLYWDPQGVGGSNPETTSLSGAWETSFWSGSSAGASYPVPWTNGDAACFAVHTGGRSPAFTVTVNSAHTVAGFFNGPLTPDPCTVTLVGPGILTLQPGNLNGFAVSGDLPGDPGYLTIAVTLAGGATAGVCPEDNNGQTFLNGTNTYSGGTYLGYSGDAYSSSIINFNNSASFGTSNIYFLNSTGGALVAEGTAAIAITNQWVLYQESPASCNIVGTPAGVTFSGAWTLSGGKPGQGASSYATNNTVLPSYGPLSLGSGGASNDLIIISGVISGTNNFSKYGVGILQLSATNTFSGNLTISNGTLALAGTGSISNAASITIAAGAALNVSAITNFYLSTNTTLTAQGSNTTTQSATIIGATNGTVNLGTNALNFNFTPTSFNGDTNHPALVISNALLTLDDVTPRIMTVTNNTSTPLGVGLYQLIQISHGFAGSFNSSTVNVVGAGLANNTVAHLNVVGGYINLNVQEPSAITDLTASQTIPAGTTNITLVGTVSGAGPIYPTNNDSLQVLINGNAQSATFTDNTGDFSINYNPSTIPASSIPYTIYYEFIGVNALATSVNSSTSLTVQSAPSIPSFAAPILSQGSVIFSCTNGVAGNPCTLLSTTNLALPLTNWTVVTTSSFDNSGQCSFTNATTLPAQFFILQTP